MLHREPQLKKPIDKYDIVVAIPHIKRLPGRMNSYNKQIAGYKEFEGYALVLGGSESYVQLYFPNRERKIIKKSLIRVAIKYTTTKEKKWNSLVIYYQLQLKL